jgi:hypothetical protein
MNKEVADNRDERFKATLRRQLGDNGVALMVNQAVLFIFALIMLVSIIVGYINFDQSNRSPRNNATMMVALSKPMFAPQ